MKSPPVKSAFGPIKPSAEALKAVVAKAQAVKQAEPKESLPPQAPEPVPSSVEIWVELVKRQDREVFGWTLLTRRTPKTKALLVGLNLHHRLVLQSLDLGDHETLALLIGLCVAEILLTRQKREAWIAATLAKLRETLLPEDKRRMNGIQFLAQTLADSDSFKRIAEKLLAPSCEANGTKQQIGTVALDPTIPSP